MTSCRDLIFGQHTSSCGTLRFPCLFGFLISIDSGSKCIKQHRCGTLVNTPQCRRQKAALARDSSRDEDALNTYLFQLVKAGRISEAAKTCEECGQPWRAASLLGGGPNGPVPLGSHAMPAVPSHLSSNGFLA